MYLLCKLRVFLAQLLSFSFLRCFVLHAVRQMEGGISDCRSHEVLGTRDNSALRIRASRWVVTGIFQGRPDLVIGRNNIFRLGLLAAKETAKKGTTDLDEGSRRCRIHQDTRCNGFFGALET
ncbi:hypothetical protein CVM50_12565 [Pseudooceanicola marinus]|nr:hypothetical protein CVM50_12565 [Pseudooceanicola marinus]